MKSSDLIKKWELTGKISPVLAKAVDRQLNVIMDEELAQIDALADKYPEAAFARYTRLAFFLNAAMIARPSIAGQIANWIYKLKFAFNKLGRKLGASEFTIRMSWSAGLYVDFTFPVD